MANSSSVHSRASWVFLLLILGFNILGLSSVLHDRLGGLGAFRSLQTAVSIDALIRDGFVWPLPTPVLGPPWSIPLEFPTYQYLVAALVEICGGSIEATGRLVSWSALLACLPALYLLLGRLGTPAYQRRVVLGFILCSPLHLFYAPDVLIETTALAAGCWFLYALHRGLSRASVGWLSLAVVFGSGCGVTKSTTLVGFLMAGLLLMFEVLRSQTRFRRITWAKAGVTVAIILGVTLLWTWNATAMRSANPEAAFLNEHFGYWSFGDLALRASGDFGIRVLANAGGVVAGAGLICLGLLGALTGKRREKLWLAAAAITFLTGPLIFANLYHVHEYYYLASGLFLITGLGVAATNLLERSWLSPAAGWSVLVCAAVLNLGWFAHQYAPQARDHEPPELAGVMSALSERNKYWIVLGHDWSAELAYYSGRRTFMLTAGREADRAAILTSMQRLNPADVAGVIIKGQLWQDGSLIREAFAPLGLGERPLLAKEAMVGIWVPESYQPEARDRWFATDFEGWWLAPPKTGKDLMLTVGGREISRRPEFVSFSPRPNRFHGYLGLSSIEIAGSTMVTTHTPTELTFDNASQYGRLEATFGLDEAAYLNAEKTDGVEFQLWRLSAKGARELIWQRWLEPVAQAADQGPQTVSIDLPDLPEGEALIWRSDPGPSQNQSYDWGYVGELRLHERN